MKPILLWSDGLIFMLVIALILFFYKLREDPQTRNRWAQVFSSKLGMVAFTVIMTYVGIALLDSLHFRLALDAPEGMQTEEVFYDNKVTSVFDVLTGGMGERFERTYSAPFALISFEKKNTVDEQGNSVRDFPPLKYAGLDLDHPSEKWADILALQM
jgi:peptide/nickel transport system permease protein